MRRIPWSFAPSDSPPQQRKNFVNVQIDAIGIGLANAAAQFLPVFLTRSGATNLQIGLLTAMPAFTGLFLAIPIGRFLQTRRQIVPWFSGSRLLVISAYALTGLVPFIVPDQTIIPVVLLIWMVATLPQIILNVAFSVVMNAVAGPTKRYDLMSRRWSLLGLTTAITVAITGQTLDRINFPINYQLVFITLSAGGLISYYYSSHIRLPDTETPQDSASKSLKERISSYWALITEEKPFISFISKRFVFLFGQTLATPLLPIYYVRTVQASDSWIGIITTVQTSVLLIGYFVWTRQSKRRGSRFVLLWVTFGLACYPALVATTHQVVLIAIFAGLAGVFQAGIDLVFFDELMKTVPMNYSATFVSFSQSIQYLSAVAAPLLGTLLATGIGLEGALLTSAAIRFIGFALFILGKKVRIS